MTMKSVDYSAEDLHKQLRAGKSAELAWLTAKANSRAIAETLCAMANGNGGILVLGVDARGHVQANTETSQLSKIASEACIQLEPPLLEAQSSQVLADGETVLVVRVPSGLQRVYSVQGAYYRRVGAFNRAMNADELRSLLLERGDAGFELQLVPGAFMSDLNMEQVLSYLESQPFSAIDNIPAALSSMGCIGLHESNLDDDSAAVRSINDYAPTVAGLLLFGRAPQHFLRSAEIICVRYAGAQMGDEFIRQDLGGCLVDQIRQAEAFVRSNMARDARIRGFEREDTSEYPTAVVREAIVNAVAHRDYSIRGEGIRIFLFSNRLEVYSPGRLPGHVTLENLVDERYSRNEAIVSVLNNMGYIERLGYGIDRMLATMEAQGLPTPVFHETAAGFKVTLYSAVHSSGSVRNGRTRLIGEELNSRQQTAMSYVRENGRITNNEYQQLAPDVSAETIRRDLVDLVSKNLLLRIGEKRATYYILK